MSTAVQTQTDTQRQLNPAPAATPEIVEQAIYQALPGLVELGDRQLGPDTRFEDLGLTSLMIVTLTFELEDRFRITVPTEHLGDFRTVAEARETILRIIRQSKA